MARTGLIARRELADGKHILLWEDGLITYALGHGIRGVGAGRSAYAIDCDLRAGWWVMGEACLFDSSEISAVIRHARKLARKSGWHTPPVPGYLRREFDRAAREAA